MIEFRMETHLIKHFAEDAVIESLDNCRYPSALLDLSLFNTVMLGIERDREKTPLYLLYQKGKAHLLRYSLGSTEHSP